MSETGFLLRGLAGSVTEYLLLGLGEGGAATPPPTPTPVPSPPTDAEIAQALAGQLGPVVARFRYEWRNHQYQMLGDISTAVEANQGYLELDNDRDTPLIGEITIRTELLPAGFVIDEAHIAIVLEVLINGYWQRFELALMHADRIRTIHRPSALSDGSRDIAHVALSDLGIHLQAQTTDVYSIAAGTNYMTALGTLLTARGLEHNLPVIAETLPVAMTFGPGTTYRKIANLLTEGVNHYPVWPDGRGEFITRERLDPPLETGAVSYVTNAEPRMVIGDEIEQEEDHTRFFNRAVVLIDHPERTPAYALRENNDGTSSISTANTGAITEKFDGQFVYDLTVAGEIAQFMLLDQVARSNIGRVRTLPDPRRGSHEFYLIDIEGEVSGLYQVFSWRLPLAVGEPMEHKIGLADSAIITEP